MFCDDSMSAATCHIDPTWPREVGIVLSALEAGYRGEERRLNPRHPYHVKADLRLFTDPADMPRHVLYTRDANSKCVGFITNDCLPLGYGGTVELVAMTGRLVTANCTILRCRQVPGDWYEGALYFNREQWEFEPQE